MTDDKGRSSDAELVAALIIFYSAFKVNRAGFQLADNFLKLLDRLLKCKVLCFHRVRRSSRIYGKSNQLISRFVWGRLLP